MEDLVGVRVADAAEDVRIGQRPLERMVHPREALGEHRQRRVENLEASRVERCELRDPCHDVHRRLTASSLFSEDGRAGREIERRQAHLAWNGRATLPPAQPSGNHQVQDQEQTAVEVKDDPLSHPPQSHDHAAFDGSDGRLDRAHEERIPEPQPLERLIKHPRGQRFEIERDVG